MPEPTPPDGILYNRSGGPPLEVQLVLLDGSTRQLVLCPGGIPSEPACVDRPQVDVGGGVSLDVPCQGDGPDGPVGCATLPPTPAPDVVAASEALEIDHLQIPIDRVGLYEVEIGRATLPNGYLSMRSAVVVDPSPEEYLVQSVVIDVRPDDASRPPIGSIYRDPFDGPEPVTVLVVFEVTGLREPAVLELRDIVVR